MPKVAIVSDDCRNRALYFNDKQLPVNYMEDFTVMGFIVNHHDKACTLLREAGYTLLESTNSTDIVIQHAGQLREIESFFKTNDIMSTYSDIADTIYQA